MKIMDDVFDNGGVLRSLIDVFNNKKDMDSIMMVFQCLRDSYVYVPCTVMIGGVAMNCLFEDDEFDSDLEVVIKPDFLSTDDGVKYFPVFSCSEMIPLEINAELCAIRKHFLDVIDWVECIRGVDHIVVDAFTNAFVVKDSVYNIIKSLPSVINEGRVLS